jgi:antibiotic biosynthesis monooxygenase (ABM) superfamily enzyme
MTVQSAAGSAQVAQVAPARPASPTFAMRTRLALLVLVAVYPVITGLIYLVAPFTAGWDVWTRNFIVAPLMVIAMVYIIIPTIQARFGRFIATGTFLNK